MGVEVRPAAGRWDDFASFTVPRQPGGRGCVFSRVGQTSGRRGGQPRWLVRRELP